MDTVRSQMWDAGVWHKGYLFQSRQKDRDNVKTVLDLVTNAGIWPFPSNYAWRSAKDIMVPFNYADLFTLNLIFAFQNEIIYNLGWKDKDITLSRMRKKVDIKNFKPTYLDTYQIQELIDERLVQFEPLIESSSHKIQG